MKTTSVRPFASTRPRLAVTAAAAGLLASLALPVAAARAAVQIIAPTASTPGSFSITDPITFTISVAGNAQAFVFDNLVTSSDGSQTSPAYSPALSFSLNGGSAMSTLGVFVDNLGVNLSALTANDGYLFLNSAFAVAVGDTVTLNAGSYTLDPVSGFNPQATQTFTGNVFITDNGANRLSGAVPEPSTYALALLGGAGLLVAVRRRTAAQRA